MHSLPIERSVRSMYETMRNWKRIRIVSILCAMIFGNILMALSPAEFDAGGMTFNLEKISAKLFSVPTGGQSGCVMRIKESEPDSPKFASLDWKNSAVQMECRTISLRYRLRVDKYPNDRKPEVLLKWRFRKKDKTGKEKIVNGYWMRIHDTSGGWREVSLPANIAPLWADFVELEFGLNGCLGQLEYKDLRITEVENPCGPNGEYIVKPVVRPMSFLDDTFALASGQAQLMYFTWRYANPLERRDSKKYDAKKWSATLDLPPGVRCLSVTDFIQRNFRNERYSDGSSTVSFNLHSNMAPYDRWNHWFLMGVVLSSDLPAGTKPGQGIFKAFYDGKPASKPISVHFSVVDAVKCESVPRRYFNGICIGSDPVCTKFGNSNATDALAKAWCEAGVRSSLGGHASIHTILRTNGVRRLSAPFRSVADGYMINPPLGCKIERPADQRFVPYDKNLPPGKKKAFARASCPVAVYEEASFFKEAVLPKLKECLSGYNCLETNWEPDAFFGQGCACDRCCAAFARYLGLPKSEVAKDWPSCVRDGGRFASKIERFRAIEHGKVVKTLHRYVCEFTGGDVSDGLIPEITWAEMADAIPYSYRQGEVDSREYVGALRWVNPWGPYVWWDVRWPYYYEKRLSLASYAAAKNVRERVDREYPPEKRPKLVAFPSGWQSKVWLAVPEWIGMAMDSFFFNRWEATEIYSFPGGYDARYWKAFADATSRAARCEDAVLDGVRSDARTFAVPVPEYAANCREATGFLPQVKDISPLQAPAYDWKGGRVVG
ncbi:MAG: hypothetical protein J6R18_02745, partial [Kiritimatiellae bacterium]|nr:hypothetical protein [Kiritimatiellia bacterium]